MDELVHHCVRELAFDGDLGQCTDFDIPIAPPAGFLRRFCAQETSSNPPDVVSFSPYLRSADAPLT